MLFSRVFRVLSDSLRDRGVDFLTVNIDEKSCYFRVFFACFLTDCKTGVLIFSCYAERRVLVHHELSKTNLNTLLFVVYPSGACTPTHHSLAPLRDRRQMSAGMVHW